MKLSSRSIRFYIELILYDNSGSSSHLNRNIDHQVSNIQRTLVGNWIVDPSDVVGASPIGAAPTTSSFPT